LQNHEGELIPLLKLYQGRKGQAEG